MDRADIYAAMDELEQDELDAIASTKPLVRPQTLNFQGGMSIEVDGVSVPTLAYIKRLENIIIAQTLSMKKQDRLIKGLEQSMRQLKTISNTHSGRFSDITNDLNQKIDRRD